MKFIATIALFVLSLTASAESCFTRTTTIQNNEVTLANTLCFAEPELELNYFEDSYVLLRYSVDGQRAFKKAKIKGNSNGDNIVIKVLVDSDSEGGSCDTFYGAYSNAIIKVKKDGSIATVEGMTGEIVYTYDQCHDQPDLIQTINYTKN